MGYELQDWIEEYGGAQDRDLKEVIMKICDVLEPHSNTEWDDVEKVGKITAILVESDWL